MSIGTWKHSSLLWSSQNATWDTLWLAVAMNTAQGETFSLSFVACRYPRKTLWPNPTWVCLPLGTCLPILNSDSVTEHRCSTFTEMGISEENGNCIRKLWIKEKIHTSRPGFLISLQIYQKTLCPICCFPPVDLVFVFTQLDSTSVSQKKSTFDKTGLLKY